ncbi:gp53-like domain-containing protein [Yersinia intermedia]|uniref:gp53-like domain-containing protein n=1 Tax=Yersinia intermedia TaxID=631 RepID=UPI00065CD1A6|nr:hypothetical protein [Yersinia intermedia]CRY77048.1 bacteriophage tail fiber protein [Yersinia intermedia]
MHRIDTPTAQVDKFGAGKNGFTRGNPQTGVPATALDDDYFDAIQEELAGVIESTGVALDKSKRTQLLTALNKLFLQSANYFSEISAEGTQAQNTARANIASAALIGLSTQVFSVANATANNHAVNLVQLNSTITALGLGTASKANIGTGTGQVPSMASFTSGPGWMKFPDGTIIQFGTNISGSAGYPTSVNFPIPFTADFRVTCSFDSPTSPADCPAFSTSKIGNTGFYLASSRQGSVTGAGAHWIAIGK